MAWQPHTYLRFAADWDDIGSGDDSHRIVASVEIPLGGGAASAPRWHGLGVASSGSSVAESDLWRSVDLRRIEVAERTVVDRADGVDIGDVSVRFMQTSAPSGSAIGLRASIPEAQTTDIRVSVKLAPGTGANPAVAGVDFADEPIEIVIPAGQVSVSMMVDLLVNPDVQAGRSLKVVV